MADDSDLIGQDEIEALLNQAKTSTPAPASSAPTPAPPAGGGSAIQQDEIDSLLNGLGGGSPPKPTSAPAVARAPTGGGVATASKPKKPGGGSAQATSGASPGDDIQMLLDQAEQAIASVNNPSSSADDAQEFQFRNLTGSPPSSEKATIDLIRDVEMDLRIELGRTHMELEELLKLRKGSVVSLDKLAGDPVDVFVNGRLIARGEVLVLNDNFCVRVAELISGDD
jgi:flagellar motor switch protein FliN